jgi:anti-sigma factor ChrR (cupin superfamily)
MLQCNEVTRLWASDAIRDTSLRTRLALRIHLMMCRYCRRYVGELRAIGGAVRGLHRQEPERDHEELIRRVLSDRSEHHD